MPRQKSLNPIVKAAVSAAIAAVPAIAATAEKGKPPIRKAKPRKRRQRRNPTAGSLLKETRLSAPVASATVFRGGSTIRFGHRPAKHPDGLTVHFRGWTGALGTPGSGTVTSHGGFSVLNGAISTSTFFSNGVYWHFPVASDNFPVLTNIGNVFLRYNIAKLTFTYKATCPTSTSGGFIVCPFDDPVAAGSLSTDPGNSSLAVAYIKSSGNVVSFPVWAESVDIPASVMCGVDKYQFDTSNTTNDDLRLSLAGVLSVVPQGLPAQTSGVLTYGDLYVDLDIELWDMVNPNIG